jgi:c-di-GMP-binding flagellar brake protein YcgR
MENRRKFTRFAISLPVEGKPFNSKRYFHTVSKDLSLNGARILSSVFISPGSFLKLDLSLIDRVVHLKAKAIWCNHQRLSDRYLTGLEFVELDENSQRCVARFLQRVQAA